MLWRVIMSSNLLLIHLSSEKKYTAFPIGETLTIGRSENCEIHIDVKGVSGKHSQITKQQQSYVLRDLESTNGTYVNNKKIRDQHILTHEDRIGIGSYKFLVWDTRNDLPLLFDVANKQTIAICEFPFTIGRLSSNHFAFSDKNASGKHAQFIEKQHKYFLQDLESTNGTLVNAQRIKECPLNHFDKIKIGNWQGIFLSCTSKEYSVTFANLPPKTVETELFIGKGDNNDIVVHHPTVSRTHCRIFYECNTLWIEDLNSSNGTQVNGEKISKWPLQHGDNVLVGNQKLLIENKEQQHGEFYMESDEGQRFTITGKSTLIGRKQGCQVRLQDTEVSGVHAEIIIDDTGVVIHDQGSRNGLYVNGLRVKKSTLNHKDRLRICSNCFTFYNNASFAIEGLEESGYALVPFENDICKTPVYLSRFLFIGKDKSNHVVINSTSNRDAQIYKEGEEYFIKDCDSALGVFVNDEAIKNHHLQHGDQIKIGAATFFFKDAQQPLEVSSSPVKSNNKAFARTAAMLVAVAFLGFFAHSLLFRKPKVEIQQDNTSKVENTVKKTTKLNDKDTIASALKDAREYSKVYRFDSAVAALNKARKKIQVIANQQTLKQHIDYFTVRKNLFDEMNTLLTVSASENPVRLYIPGKGICSVNKADQNTSQLILENRDQKIFPYPWKKISPKMFLYIAEQLTLDEKYALTLMEMAQEFLFPEECEKYAISALENFPQQKKHVDQVYAKMIGIPIPKGGFAVYKGRLLPQEKIAQLRQQEIARNKREQDIKEQQQREQDRLKAIEMAKQKEREEFPVRYSIIDEFARTYNYRKAQEQFAKLLEDTTIQTFRVRIQRRMKEIRPLAKLFDKLISAIKARKLKNDRVQIGDIQGVITTATYRHFQITIPNGEIRQRWYYLSPQKIYDFFARMRYESDDLYYIGVFCFENELIDEGNTSFIDFLGQNPRGQRRVDLYISQKFNVPIPKGGFVAYRGKLISPEERGNLAKGLVRHGKEWVTPADKERLEQGLVKYEGKWITVDEQKLLARGYVKYKGKWHSKAEINEIRSNWEDAWTMSTEHYEIRTNISEEFLNEFASIMEQSYAVYKKFFGDIDARRRMTLFAFKGYEDYRKFCIDTGQQNSLRAGGFAHPGMNVGVGWKRNSNAQLLNTMIHEGGHLFQFNAYPRSSSPSWLSEAIATQFEGFTWNRQTKKLSFDFVSQQRLSWIKRNILRKDYFSIPDLIQGRAIEFINSDPQKAMTFYSQNWALYYYLTHTKVEKYRVAFQKFLQQVHGGGVRGREATIFLQTFEGELDNIEKLWTTFISGL